MKVTQDQVNEFVVDTKYFYDGTLTIAILTLKNGFKVIGDSACVDPTEYDQQLGETLARSRAVEKVWAYLGFQMMGSGQGGTGPGNFQLGDMPIDPDSTDKPVSMLDRVKETLTEDAKQFIGRPIREVCEKLGLDYGATENAAPMKTDIGEAVGAKVVDADETKPPFMTGQGDLYAASLKHPDDK